MITNFYKNNKLVLTNKEIKRLEEYFKEFGKYDNWETFSSPVFEILNKSLPVTDYYRNQYKTRTALQGGKLLEIVIGETLGVMFGANYTSNGNFENEKYCITLTGEKGKGTGNVADITILDKESGHEFIGEIKDEIARSGDCDLKYDEEGHLYPSAKSSKWDEAWRPILNGFNANTCVFDWAGHNYSISDKKEVCENIARNYFNGIDFLFTCKEDYLVTIPTNNFDTISRLFSYDGSEIRLLNGKNAVKPFTEKYLNNAILNSEYFIEEMPNGYLMKTEVLRERNSRGGGTSTKYNFIPGFVVKKNGVTFNNEKDECIIDKKSILQSNASISVHMTIKKSYSELKKIFEED